MPYIPYVPTDWETGEIITEALLDKLENGLAESSPKIVTGTIPTNSTTVTVAYNGTLLGTRCVMNGEEVGVDKIVSGQAVIFTLAENPAYLVTCYVIYV